MGHAHPKAPCKATLPYRALWDPVVLALARHRPLTAGTGDIVLGEGRIGGLTPAGLAGSSAKYSLYSDCSSYRCGCLVLCMGSMNSLPIPVVLALTALLLRAEKMPLKYPLGQAGTHLQDYET